MPTLSLMAKPCGDCLASLSCTIVRCPKCQGLNYLDHWEVYDDERNGIYCLGQHVSICPANDCIVESYETLATNKFICRLAAEAQAREELKPKPKRTRKPRTKKFNHRDTEVTENVEVKV